MSKMFRNAAMASSIALMAFAGAGMASAQSNDNSKTLNDCGNQQNCGDQKPGNSGKQRSQNSQGYGQSEDQPGDMKMHKKPRQNSQSNNSGNQLETMQVNKKRSAQNNNNNNRNWKYDSNRHDRRRSKNSQFRFYFGGFYYAQPYWAGESYGSYGVQSYRVSCGEGRSIVDDNGYNRVRTIECGGGTFTYLGRRNGDTFKVFLNSRTGRIVGRQAV